MVSAQIVFLVCSVFQIAVTLPMLFDRGSTIPRETSIPTTLIWLIYGVTYFTISYPLAGVASIVGGALWALVAVFRDRASLEDTDYITDDLLSDD